MPFNNDFTTRKTKVMILLKKYKEEQFSTSKIAILCGMNYWIAEKTLEELLAERLVEKIKDSKWTRWRLK